MFAGLSGVENLATLTWLSVSDCDLVNDSDRYALSALLQLRSLDLSGTKVTHTTLPSLLPLTLLTHICLDGCTKVRCAWRIFSGTCIDITAPAPPINGIHTLAPASAPRRHNSSCSYSCEHSAFRLCICEPNAKHSTTAGWVHPNMPWQTLARSVLAESAVRC